MFDKSDAAETHLLVITPKDVMDTYNCTLETARKIIADLCFEIQSQLPGHLDRLAFEYKLTTPTIKRLAQSSTTTIETVAGVLG